MASYNYDFARSVVELGTHSSRLQKHGSEIIYYSVELPNVNTSKTFDVQFKESRREPILRNPSDYYAAVDQFSFSGILIPLLQFEAQGYVELEGTGTINIGGPANVTFTVPLSDELVVGNYIELTDGGAPPTPSVTGQRVQVKVVTADTTTGLATVTIDLPFAITAGGDIEYVKLPPETSTPVPGYNIGSYTITLQYDDKIARVPLIYKPNDLDTIPPNRNLTTTNTNWPRTDYYYVYSYEQMLNMINEAMETAYVNLFALGGIPVIPPPKLVFNSQEQLIQYYVDKGTFDEELAPTVRFSLYTNTSLVNYLEGFEYEFQQRPQTQGRRFRTIFRDELVNTVTISGDTYLLVEQEFQALSYWNALRSIVIKSNTIPLLGENVATIKSEGRANISPILFEYVPDFKQTGETRLTLQYDSKGEYKMISMQGGNPLREIQFEVYWRNNLGDDYLIKIPDDSSFSMRLLFIKK